MNIIIEPLFNLILRGIELIKELKGKDIDEEQ